MARSGGSAKRKAPTTIDATITEACVLAPVESLTAEREFEDEMGKELLSPAVMFAAPSALNSAFASTS